MRMQMHRLPPVGVGISASSTLGLYPPPCGEGIGGLRPPFLAPRTPMRSSGYAPKRSEGGRGGGRATPAQVAPPLSRRTTPTPNPSPQGNGGVLASVEITTYFHPLS